MIDGYDVSVQLLMMTPDAERLIEEAGRRCYATEDRTGTVPGWIQKRIQEGHETILEHATATFLIRCSRAASHELVRHRIASYSQRSQRYVREREPRFITPPELLGDAVICFHDAMKDAWGCYGLLLEAGVKPEIARYVLPNACETQIEMTMNFRELRHFIKLRTSPRALPEMRAVAGEVKRIMKEVAPEVFADI